MADAPPPQISTRKLAQKKKQNTHTNDRERELTRKAGESAECTPSLSERKERTKPEPSKHAGKYKNAILPESIETSHFSTVDGSASFPPRRGEGVKW